MIKINNSENGTGDGTLSCIMAGQSTVPYLIFPCIIFSQKLIKDLFKYVQGEVDFGFGDA